jgi:hypothetical protein
VQNLIWAKNKRTPAKDKRLKNMNEIKTGIRTIKSTDIIQFLFLCFSIILCNCSNPTQIELYEGKGISIDELQGGWFMTKDYLDDNSKEYIYFTNSNWFYWKSLRIGWTNPISEGYGRFNICGMWNETIHVKYLRSFETSIIDDKTYSFFRDSTDDFFLPESIQYRIENEYLIEYSRAEVIVGNKFKGFSASDRKRYITKDDNYSKEVMWEMIEKPDAWEE